MRHARTLVTINEPKAQLKIYDGIIDQELSVRKVGELVRKLNEEQKKDEAIPEQPEVLKEILPQEYESLKDIIVNRHTYDLIVKGIPTGALLFFSFASFAMDRGVQSDTASISMEESQVNNNNRDSVKLKRTIDIDTLSTKALRNRVHSPQKATIFSALLPGLGQAYNHKYWKIPCIYALGAVIYYSYDFHNKQYLMYKKLYEKDVINGGNATDKETYQYDLEIYNSRRTRDILFMSMLYMANIIDALTDAYFFHYDISNNLTLNVHPQIMSVNKFAMNGYSTGFSLSLRF